MRTTKELLTILLGEYEKSILPSGKSQSSGLCCLLANLYDKRIISSEEYDILFLYISYNRPFYKKQNSYGWKPYLTKARIKWLKKHIELNK